MADADRCRPWPVTLGEPNAFGLYGIAANVHEWCADWHDARLLRGVAGTQSARAGVAAPRRASRGGSWRHAVTISRCAARSKIDPSFRYTDYGFRGAHAVTLAPDGRGRDRAHASATPAGAR